MCRSRNLISLLVRVQTNSATVEISLEMSQVIEDTSFFFKKIKYCFFFPLSLSCSLAIQCGRQKQVFFNGDSSPGPGPDFSHNCSSDSPTLLSALPPPQRRKEAEDSQCQQHLKRSNICNYMSIFVPEPYSCLSSMNLGFLKEDNFLALRLGRLTQVALYISFPQTSPPWLLSPLTPNT